MKSKIFYLVSSMMLIPVFLFSQVKPQIEFENYTPVWQHITVDSSSISYSVDGMNMFYVPGFLFTPSDIYTITKFSIINRSGVFLERLNAKTGKRIWSNYFDPMHNNDKYEYLSDYGFNNDSIEILCFRDENNDPLFEKENKYSRWEFDINTGEILEHYYATLQDTTSPVLINNLANKGILQKMDKNKYFYIPLQVEFFQNCDSCDALVYILDRYGKLLSQKKIYNLPSNRQGVEKWIDRVVRVSEDTILLFQKNFIAWNDTAKVNCYIDYVDTAFNLLYSKKLDGLDFEPTRYSWASLGLVGVNNILVSSTDDKKIESKLYIYDKQGNFIKKYDLKSFDGNGLVRVIMTQLNDGEYLISGTTFRTISNQNNTLVFFKLDKDLNLNTIKEFKVIPKNHYLSTENIAQLPNGDIILGGRHKYNIFFASGGYAETRGYWQTWLKMKAEDIGLTTSTKEINTEMNFVLSPNPTSGQFSISFAGNEMGDMIITNIFGQQIFSKKDVKNGENINLTGLSPGTYLVAIKTKNGLSVRKLVIAK